MNPENIVPSPGPGPGPHPGPMPLPESPILGTSNKQPAVTGNSQTNIGVLGQSLGIQGGAPATDGVFGLGLNGVHGQAAVAGGSGVLGESYLGQNGVHGKSATAGGNGVLGEHSGDGKGVTGTSQQGSGVYGTTSAAVFAGVEGVNIGGGTGVSGFSQSGVGVLGWSEKKAGVSGTSAGYDGVHGESQSPQHAGVSGSNSSGGSGVWGSSNSGHGVYGQTASQLDGSAGLCGVNTGKGFGVYGEGDGNTAVVGKSTNFNGGWFESSQAEGVRGVSHNPNHGAVVGICDKANGIGVYGFCDDGSKNLSGTGVFGDSSLGEGVHGQTNSPTMAGVAGIMLNPQGTGAGVYGESRGQGPAGYFKGNVVVTGDVALVNQDCAEDFNISLADEIEPGTVMVIQEGDVLQMSHCAYDKRVAGVISGAGTLKPAIVLGKQSSQNKRMPVALLGKVYCKVDAHYSAVDVGDLLTTSSTPGHAMKATDPTRAFGAVIGKALEPLNTGQGLIPILVALQ